MHSEILNHGPTYGNRDVFECLHHKNVMPWNHLNSTPTCPTRIHSSYKGDPICTNVIGKAQGHSCINDVFQKEVDHTCNQTCAQVQQVCSVHDGLYLGNDPCFSEKFGKVPCNVIPSKQYDLSQKLHNCTCQKNHSAEPTQHTHQLSSQDLEIQSAHHDLKNKVISSSIANTLGITIPGRIKGVMESLPQTMPIFSPKFVIPSHLAPDLDNSVHTPSERLDQPPIFKVPETSDRLDEPPISTVPETSDRLDKPPIFTVPETSDRLDEPPIPTVPETSEKMSTSCDTNQTPPNITQEQKDNMLINAVFAAVNIKMKNNMVSVQVCGISTTALVDTGASSCCMSPHFLARCKKKCNIFLDESRARPLHNASGQSMRVLGEVETSIDIEGFQTGLKAQVVQGLPCDIFLSWEFLKENNAKIDCVRKQLSFHDNLVTAAIVSQAELETQFKVYSAKTIRLRPHSVTKIPAKTRPGTFQSIIQFKTQHGLCTHSEYDSDEHQSVMTKILPKYQVGSLIAADFSLATIFSDDSTYVTIINPGNETMIIHHNAPVAICEPFDTAELNLTDDTDDMEHAHPSTDEYSSSEKFNKATQVNFLEDTIFENDIDPLRHTHPDSINFVDWEQDDLNKEVQTNITLSPWLHDSNVFTTQAVTLERGEEKHINYAPIDWPKLLGKTDLPPDQYKQLLELLNANRKVFSVNLEELGVVTHVQHEIEVPEDATPVKQRAYRMNLANQQELDDQIAQLLKENIIEVSDSEWRSSCFLVRKKDINPNSPPRFRLVIDYRRLNALTKPVFYPMPTFDQLADNLSETKATIFSSLDLKSAYHQLLIHPDSRDYTTFSTGRACYRWRRLCFGLAYSPFTFSKALARALSPLGQKYVNNYLDDVIVASRDAKSHLEHLQAVFSQLQCFGFTIDPNKCDFAKKEIKFLGFIVTADGIKPDPEKVRALTTFPTPKTITQLRRALGMTSFYRRFVNNYAAIAAPLFEVLKKGVPFQWTKEMEESFTKIRQELLNNAILYHPDLNKPFFITTDASKNSVAHSVSQLDDNNVLRPISFFSKTLSKQERKWNSNEKECWSLVLAFRRNRHLLGASKIYCVTDNLTTRYLQQLKTSSNPKILKWSLELQRFPYDIIHRPGSQIKCVDALSRIELPDNTQVNEMLESDFDDTDEGILGVTSDDPVISVRDLFHANVHQSVASVLDKVTVDGVYVNNFDRALMEESSPEREDKFIATMLNGVDESTINHVYIPVNSEHAQPLKQESVCGIRDMYKLSSPDFIEFVHQILRRSKDDKPNENKLRSYAAHRLAEYKKLARPVLQTIARVTEDGVYIPHRNGIHAVTRNQAKQQKLHSSLSPQDTQLAQDTDSSESSSQTDSSDSIPVSQDDSDDKQTPAPEIDCQSIFPEMTADAFTEAQLKTLMERYTGNLKQLVSYQKKDRFFRQMFNFLEHGKLPRNKQRARRIVHDADNWSISDEKVLLHIYKLPKSRDPTDTVIQIALPEEYRHEILIQYHNNLMGAHQGVPRLISSIRQNFYWPKMVADIVQFVKSCDQCQKAKRSMDYLKAPLQTRGVSPFMASIHLDCIHLPRSQESYTVLLVIIDHFSKMVELVPCVNETAACLARNLFRSWFCRFGLPMQITSDRHASFTSGILKELTKYLGVKHIRVSSNHPQANGQVERFNSTLLNSIRAVAQKYPLSWPQILPAVRWAYNSSIQDSTQYSAFELAYGVTPRQLDGYLLTDPSQIHATVQQTVEHLLPELALYRQTAQRNMEAAAARQKKQYDQRRKSGFRNYEIGTLVLLKDYRPPKESTTKFSLPFDGPYRVVQRYGPVLYLLQHAHTYTYFPSLIHQDRLRTYYEPTQARIRQLPAEAPTHPRRRQVQNNQPQLTQQTQTQQQPPPPQTQPRHQPQPPTISVPGREQPPDVVTKIITSRMVGDRKQFQVKWRQNPRSTWVYADKVTPLQIADYNERVAARAARAQAR